MPVGDRLSFAMMWAVFSFNKVERTRNRCVQCFCFESWYSSSHNKGSRSCTFVWNRWDFFVDNFAAHCCYSLQMLWVLEIFESARLCCSFVYSVSLSWHDTHKLVQRDIRTLTCSTLCRENKTLESAGQTFDTVNFKGISILWLIHYRQVRYEI